MNFEFFKYHGTGNDFIIIDKRENVFNYSEEKISLFCNRRLGIGADGLILIEKNNDTNFFMRYFNSNGKEGSMCGNGGRCAAAFAYKHLKTHKNIIFSAFDGNHQAEIISTDETVSHVRLKMNDVVEIKKENDYYFLDTGSPHYVTFIRNIDEIDIKTTGKMIRNSALFSPEGTNVDFVENRNGKLYVRTYERGVEDETLSCGTGVTASAIAASFFIDASEFEILTRGGNLKVFFHRNGNRFTDIWLEGPATFVYSGRIEI